MIEEILCERDGIGEEIAGQQCAECHASISTGGMFAQYSLHIAGPCHTQDCSQYQVARAPHASLPAAAAAVSGARLIGRRRQRAQQQHTPRAAERAHELPMLVPRVHLSHTRVVRVQLLLRLWARRCESVFCGEQPREAST